MYYTSVISAAKQTSIVEGCVQIRVQVHIFASASKQILGTPPETVRPFQTYLLECVES